MIKIAVSLSGMPRNFEQCYENTFEFFDIDDAQVDFFIHCWSNSWYPKRARSKQKDPTTGIKLDESELYNSLQQVYKPKKIITEDQLSNKDLLRSVDDIKSILLTEDSKRRLPKWMVKMIESGKIDFFLSQPFHLAQTYSISKTADMISEDNEDYDLVMRYRFDNYVKLQDRHSRTEMFHNMANLIKHAESMKELNNFVRDYLFVAWMTIMNEDGFRGNTTWIGDKIFACSKEKFGVFSDYFRIQLNKITTFNPANIHTEHNALHLMPEHTIYNLCMGKSFFIHSKGYLNNLSLVTYRDYHMNLEQTFEVLQREYIKREKRNHDSADGIVLGL